MKTSNFIYVLISGLLLLAACNEDYPLDDEQYIKQVYLVGADETSNMGMLTREISYADSIAEADISVAVGGSRSIEEDVTVTVEEMGSDAIDDYNVKYMDGEDVTYRLLDESTYSIPSLSTTIAAGDQYATIPVYVNTTNLSCDSLYALTFQISSVSDPDYVSIRDEDTTLILSFSIVNDYSGTYQLDGYYYEWNNGVASDDSTSISTTRTLTATSKNSVRFYHLSKTEDTDNLADYGVCVTIADDNTLTIQAYSDMELTDAEGTYDPDEGVFTIKYNYTDDGQEYQFSGTYTYSDD